MTMMTMINLTKFFNGFRTTFGPLTQTQVNGLDFLLRKFNETPRWMDMRNVAYALATMVIETGNTFQPIVERGSKLYLSRYYLKPSLRRSLGNIRLSDSWNFRGRGYVQITGRRNYTVFAGILNHPLITAPELALEKSIAFRIMTIGMFEGRFTGKRLGHYITPTETDYFNARRVINGLDRAAEIKQIAIKFERILRNATD